MKRQTVSKLTASALVLSALGLTVALSACGSGEVPLAQPSETADQLVALEDDGTLGEPMLSSDPTKWNTPIEPALGIDDVPVPITAELPVVEFPGRALGGGILDAGASILGMDADYLYVSIGGSTGCASFEHLALVPTEVTGEYELFQDTDNLCEAAGGSGYRTPRADLTLAADGSIAIRNTNGTTTTITPD